MSEAMWMERAERAESIIFTQKEAFAAAMDRVKEFKMNFGIKERSNGDIDIDFDKFAANLGAEAALALRKVIDDQYNISGNAGDKPRMKIAV